MMQAILIVSHGSRFSKTLNEVSRLADQIKTKTDVPVVRYAFLELQDPDIPTGIEACIEEGAEEVYILLNFLNAGRHVDEDIPRIIRQAQDKHPQVKIRLSAPLGQHQKIPDLFLDLIKDLQTDE